MGSKINSLKLKEWRSNSANFATINPDQKFLRPKIENGTSGSKLVKNIFTIIFIGISLFMFYNIFKSLNIANQKNMILDQAKEEVTQLRIENVKLVMESTSVGTEDYVIREARNRLNYTKEGEIRVVIPDNVIASIRAKYETVNHDKTPLSGNLKDNLLIWQDFVINGI